MSETNENDINVKILFFGAAREAVGVEEINLDVPFAASVSGVKKAVFSRYETLSRFAQSLMIAVNEEYATNETIVKSRDEIAFLPPVSGG